MAPVGDEVLVAYADLVDAFSIHDGLVAASHEVEETDAIITADGVIAGAGYETLWD